MFPLVLFNRTPKNEKWTVLGGKFFKYPRLHKNVCALIDFTLGEWRRNVELVELENSCLSQLIIRGQGNCCFSANCHSISAFVTCSGLSALIVQFTKPVTNLARSLGYCRSRVLAKPKTFCRVDLSD